MWEFIASHGDHPASLILVRADCVGNGAPGDTFVDGLSFGTNGSSTTYDFESSIQKPTVTMKVKDPTLRSGDNVVVTGTVNPASPGSYKIVKELNRKGTYRLFVTVPASPMNEAGRSRVAEVTVRRRETLSTRP